MVRRRWREGLAPERRPLVLGTQALAVVVGLVAAARSPIPPFVHWDHLAMLETLDRLRGGSGLYEAVVEGQASIGNELSQVRSVREPWLFVLWSLIPTARIEVLYYLVVAAGSAVVTAPFLRFPPAALVVTLYLCWYGGYGDIEQWLLSEPWTAPLVLGACAAWLRDRPALAATLAVAATLVREQCVLLVGGFLLFSWLSGRPLRPWIAASAAVLVGFAAHALLASPHLVAEGKEAPILGSGGASSVVNMTGLFGLPDLVGFAAWIAGVVLLWRSQLRPCVPLALTPLLGLVAGRPYWAVLAMPLCLLSLGGLPPATGLWPGSPADATTGSQPSPAPGRERSHR